jgi:hypothetical protein
LRNLLPQQGGAHLRELRLLQLQGIYRKEKGEFVKDDVSLCKSCNCMTHTRLGMCGKCHADKPKEWCLLEALEEQKKKKTEDSEPPDRGDLDGRD